MNMSKYSYVDECPYATSEAQFRRRGVCVNNESKGSVCYNSNCRYHKSRSYSFYFGFPIDFNNKENIELVNKEIPSILKEYGTIYNPYLAFSQSDKVTFNSSYIERVNEYAIRHSDITVFYLNPEIFTMGVVIEIWMAVRMYRIPTVIYTTRPMYSVYLDAIASNDMVHIVHSLDDLRDTLSDIVHMLDEE